MGILSRLRLSQKFYPLSGNVDIREKSRISRVTFWYVHIYKNSRAWVFQEQNWAASQSSPFVGTCHHPPAPLPSSGCSFPFSSVDSYVLPGFFSSQIPALALAFALDGTLQSSFLALFLGLARIYFLRGKAFSLSFHVITSGSGWIEEIDKSRHGRCTIIPSCGRLSQEVHEFVLA